MTENTSTEFIFYRFDIVFLKNQKKSSGNVLQIGTLCSHLSDSD